MTLMPPTIKNASPGGDSFLASAPAAGGDGVLPHRAVMLAEAVDGLNIREGGVYVDATFGAGGHAREILRRLDCDGVLLAADMDAAAEECADALADSRFRFFRRNFAAMEDILRVAGHRAADGVLMDLGASSMQLDNPVRGFSFLREGPLDMRMNRDAPQTAAAYLRATSEGDLAKALFELGGERAARRIAKALAAAARADALHTTADIARVVMKKIGGGGRRHPATRTFQAIRMAVNGEMESLAAGLAAALKILAPGGRLAVVSFHSGEDRAVKSFIRESSALRPLGKMSRPTEAEIAANPRSRGAKLRVAEKIGEGGDKKK